MHREIKVVPKGKIIDHINDNGLDNRKSNLRFCTNRQNLSRRRIPKDTIKSSHYRGVDRNKNKWRARVWYHKSKLYIGCFDNEFTAALAYDLWAFYLKGQFARLNFPNALHG